MSRGRIEVSGRRLEMSVSEFENSCLAQLREVVKEGSLNYDLIKVLNNAVRLARQHADQNKPRCQCNAYETCDICRAETEADLRRLRQTVNTRARTVDDGTQNDPHERLS